MTKNFEDEEAVAKLKQLVEQVRICMFATSDESSNIFSRPMATIEADNEGNIWFFTNEYSEKVQDISKDNVVYLFYSHPDKNTYVHVKGTCEIIDNKDKIKDKWNPMMKAWFPLGPEDPKLCFLKVKAEEASYWDGTSSKLVTFYKMIKSIATGNEFKHGDVGNLKL